MSKKIKLVVVLAGLCALSLFLLNCGSSSSRPTGLLYVLTQGTAGVGDNISSFSINLGSGNLSLINSNASTCTTSGTSCGPPLDIVLDPAGAAAFVLNQGVATAGVAPTIYPYTINSDGSFSSPATPVSWNCIGPAGGACTSYDDIPVAMARDEAGQFLFVIDAGSPVPPATCPARGAAVQTSTDATNFSGCPSISVFATKSGSNSLTFVSQSATYQSPFFVSKIPSALSLLTFSSGEFLFVSNHTDICTIGCNPPHNDNTLSVYSVDTNGILTEQSSSPYVVASVNPISVKAVNTNQTGQTNTGGIFVYVGSQPTASGALNIFEMCTVLGQSNCSQQDVTNMNLVPVTNPAPPATGANPVAMTVDPTSSFLYIVAYGSNQVWAYKINPTAGTLTALNPASQPTGAQPVALALHPSVGSSGQFLYTSNSGSSNISGFTLNTTSGAMTTPITVTSPSVPSGIVAK